MDATSDRSPLPQFYSLLIGPIAWATDLGFSYMSVYHACSTGHFYVLHVISLIALIVALTGAFVGWREFQAVRQGFDDGGTPLDRSHFMALLGIASSIGFAVVIIATAVPRFILSPCD